MPKHNNIVPNVHFHKDWQNRVKTWFNQPGRKIRRRKARIAKAARIFPRPLNTLRPVVHPPSIRYNRKVRLGRGFTLEELKEAGINPKEAKTIGISVDYRRRNKSDVSFKTNVQRLKEYKSKLVLFPRSTKTKKGEEKKLKAGEASKEEMAKAQQLQGVILPIQKETKEIETIEKKTIHPHYSATRILRKARTDARLIGKRAKRKQKKKEKAALKAQQKLKA